MIAIGLAAVVVRDDSIDESQLRSRADAPGHRARFGLPLLGSTPAREVMRPPRLPIPAATRLADASAALRAAHATSAPVVDGARYQGILTLDGTDHDPAAPAATVVDTTHPTVSADASLDSALDAMVSAGVSSLPVLERDRVVGVIAMTEIIGGYQTALRRALRLLTGVTGTAVLMEVTVSPSSPFAGRRVANAPWPIGCVAVSIDRHSQLVAPTPDTKIHPRDVIVLVAPAGSEANIRNLIETTS